MSNNIDQLRAFHELYKTGVITKEDFELQKEKFLTPKVEKAYEKVEQVSVRTEQEEVKQISPNDNTGFFSLILWNILPIGFLGIAFFLTTKNGISSTENTHSSPYSSNSNKTNSFSSYDNSITNYNRCSEPDQRGSYRNAVISRLQQTGKIPSFVEFNGNGNYVVQAYDIQYGVTFGGFVKVNNCGEIVDVKLNID